MAGAAAKMPAKDKLAVIGASHYNWIVTSAVKFQAMLAAIQNCFKIGFIFKSETTGTYKTCISNVAPMVKLSRP